MWGQRFTHICNAAYCVYVLVRAADSDTGAVLPTHATHLSPTKRATKYYMNIGLLIMNQSFLLVYTGF